MTRLLLAASIALFATAGAQRLQAKVKYGESVAGGHKQHATTQTCPSGYYLEGQRCLNKQEVAEELSCPTGSVERNGQCLDFSAGRWTCSGDLNLLGRSCVGKEYTDKTRRCPEGSILRDNECVVLGDYPFECPEDAVTENGRCALIMAKLRRCPDGYKNLGDLCVTREQAQPETICARGEMEGNRCIITFPIEKVCPSGYENFGATCATYKDEVERCPEGFRPAGSWCTKTEEVEKTIQCGNGQNPSDNCAVKVDVPLSPICNVGKMMDGQCTETSYEPAVYSCPAGYELNGTTCSKSQSYDCSTTEH
eukprot:Selendium_serpulae@DN6305_c0_g1_i4.p1